MTFRIVQNDTVIDGISMRKAMYCGVLIDAAYRKQISKNLIFNWDETKLSGY